MHSRGSSTRSTFIFLGQADYGAVPLTGGYVIVDANVLSSLHSLANSGYNPEEPRHRKAAHFLRWLRHHQVETVSTLFASLEISGVRDGAVSLERLVHWSTPFQAVRQLELDDLNEWLASGLPAGALLDGAELEMRYQFQLDDADLLIRDTFGPAYATTLVLRKAWQESLSAKATIDSVAQVLENDLNFVPTLPWLVALVSQLGKSRTRQILQQNLFKYASRNERQNLIGAAWDISYLQFMKKIQVEGGDQFAPILVTDDKALGEVGALFVDGSLGTPYESEIFPANRELYHGFYTDMLRRRRNAHPTLPSRELLVSTINILERDLGLGLSSLEIQGSAQPLDIEPAVLVELLISLRVTGKARLQRIAAAQDKGPSLGNALALAAILTKDNADCRGRAVSESLQSTMLAIRDSADVEAAGVPFYPEQVLSNFVMQHQLTTSVLLAELSREDDAQLAFATVVYIMLYVELLVTDSSNAHGVPFITTVNLLIERVSNLPSA